VSKISQQSTQRLKFALPKGRLLEPTANLLSDAQLAFDDYSSESRQYRLASQKHPNLTAKVFQEKDIPVQVAIGNYDLGICGMDWIEELVSRFPSSDIVTVANFEYGKGNVYLAAYATTELLSSKELIDKKDEWTIVSEYPNIAYATALKARLRSFKVVPVWGASRSYPPENADLAVLFADSKEMLQRYSLYSIEELLHSKACLIVNRTSLETKDMGFILKNLSSVRTFPQPTPEKKYTPDNTPSIILDKNRKSTIKLALPDGHQKKPCSRLLELSGIDTKEYNKRDCQRPDLKIDWLGSKVIRPQDMPLQVANNHFDIAITGIDWMTEHLCQYPTSPVVQVLDLGFGEVRIVAAASNDLLINDNVDLQHFVSNRLDRPLKVASEYINIADKYLRENHIHPYKLIPTWGASEAFLPEDADLLIDNTQTGKTLVKHNLKIIDVLFNSTACLIGNKEAMIHPDKKGRIHEFVDLLRIGLSCEE
jgi:ATP phosphoribosyltransferase